MEQLFHLCLTFLMQLHPANLFHHLFWMLFIIASCTFWYMIYHTIMGFISVLMFFVSYFTACGQLLWPALHFIHTFILTAGVLVVLPIFIPCFFTCIVNLPMSVRLIKYKLKITDGP